MRPGAERASSLDHFAGSRGRFAAWLCDRYTVPHNAALLVRIRMESRNLDKELGNASSSEEETQCKCDRS